MTPVPTILDALQWRYAAKQFDPERTIDDATWQGLEDSLVLTPSSYGLQPWKFMIVRDRELRERLVAHTWGQRQVADCSHLVAMLAPKAIDEAWVDRFISRTAEVRGLTLERLAGYRRVIAGDVLTGERSKGAAEWAARQVYIALGQFMLACAMAGVDTCPMEGFVPEKYDELLGLESTGLTTVVLCPAGYRSANDRMAGAAKVRFPAEDVIVHR